MLLSTTGMANFLSYLLNELYQIILRKFLYLLIRITLFINARIQVTETTRSKLKVSPDVDYRPQKLRTKDKSSMIFMKSVCLGGHDMDTDIVQRFESDSSSQPVPTFESDICTIEDSSHAVNLEDGKCIADIAHVSDVKIGDEHGQIGDDWTDKIASDHDIQFDGKIDGGNDKIISEDEIVPDEIEKAAHDSVPKIEDQIVDAHSVDKKSEVKFEIPQHFKFRALHINLVVIFLLLAVHIPSSPTAIHLPIPFNSTSWSSMNGSVLARKNESGCFSFDYSLQHRRSMYSGSDKTAYIVDPTTTVHQSESFLEIDISLIDILRYCHMLLLLSVVGAIAIKRADPYFQLQENYVFQTLTHNDEPAFEELKRARLTCITRPGDMDAVEESHSELHSNSGSSPPNTPTATALQPFPTNAEDLNIGSVTPDLDYLSNMVPREETVDNYEKIDHSLLFKENHLEDLPRKFTEEYAGGIITDISDTNSTDMPTSENNFPVEKPDLLDDEITVTANEGQCYIGDTIEQENEDDSATIPTAAQNTDEDSLLEGPRVSDVPGNMETEITPMDNEVELQEDEIDSAVIPHSQITVLPTARLSPSSYPVFSKLEYLVYGSHASAPKLAAYYVYNYIVSTPKIS